MLSELDPRLRKRLSWSIVLLACLGYLSLGVAEQGARGSTVGAPPDAPLPFPRHRVFGLSLTGLTSLQALEWLQSAGSEPLGLIVIPIDADVVSALGQPDAQPAALAAMDALISAAGGSSIAACLRKPPETVGGLGIAQAAVGTLTERYPNQISYVFACDYDDDPQWQRDVARSTLNAAMIGDSRASLIPVASGGTIRIVRLSAIDELEAPGGVPVSSAGYTLLVIPVAQAITPQNVESAERALRDTTHAAMIVIEPGSGLDPSTTAASIRDAMIDGPTLAEGFTSVTWPWLATSEGWQGSSVGTVPYIRSVRSGDTLAVEFVGTELYLTALLGPDAGAINVWIDPPSTPGLSPNVTLDLAAPQARDASIPLAVGLPATRHRVTIQTGVNDGESVSLSGLYVAGKPTSSWIGGVAAIALACVAIGALAERCLSAVAAIRATTAPGAAVTPDGDHPRVFSRR